MTIYINMLKKLCSESSDKFDCKLCDYSTSRSSQYQRHIETDKHKYNVKSTFCQQSSTDFNDLGSKCVCECGKIYKERSGLWRHKKVCNFYEKNHNNATIIEKTDDKNDKLIEDNYNRYLKEREDADNFLKQQEIDAAYFKSIDDAELARKQALKDQEAIDTEMLSAFKIEQWEFEAKRQKEIDEKAVADKKIIEEQKVQAVQSTLSTIGNLAELFTGKSRKQQEQAFKIQKAANIANATIDTYKAATGAYASLSTIPVVGPALGIEAAAAALTAGLLNVKKISSTKFDSGGATGSGGGGGATGGGGTQGVGNVITPNFNIVGANGTNQLEQLKQAPIQAYVVSGEMSTQQSLDRNRLRNATL